MNIEQVMLWRFYAHLLGTFLNWTLLVMLFKDEMERAFRSSSTMLLTGLQRNKAQL